MEGAVDGMSVHRTEDETMSPLESLDPHRLRDVVVDQHSMAAGGHIQRMQSMQCFQWSTSAIPALIHAAGQSPHRGHSRESNNSGSPAAQRRRLSSGSDSHSMQQHPHNGQPSSNFNEQQRTPINFSQNNEIHSPNARAAAMPIQSSQHTQQPLRMVPAQSPLGSPLAHHPSVQSPFNRNTPGPSLTPSSPFPMQLNHLPGQSPSSAGLPGMGPIGQQPQTPQNHVNPASQVNVSPSQNQNMFPNPQTPRSVAYPPVSSQATPSAQSQHTSYQFPASVGQVPGAQQPPQQQQQWMSPQQMQQHFAGQPRMFGNPAGQRVLVQRVQYPQGYNPAMTQAQPGYPPRPSRLPYPPPGNPSAPASQQPGGQPPQPPQRTPPVTSPPVAYPPAMQTKEQQQQAAQQQQTQQQQQQSMNGFVLPATQPVPPQTPQTPSGFSSALTNAFQPPPGASAQATLTPRTPQTPQVRPSLMNAVPQPPPQHITSPHSMYPSGSVTPSQAPPFTPRFGPPVQGVSPQYPNAADLRSPGLMSPTQSLRPQCLPGVPLEPLVPNMNMMRVATQPSHFYGHDVHFSMPLDMCLMGCNFFLVENERNLNDKHDLANLSAVIKYHGGDLKWGNQGYTDRTTHVICESYQHATVRNDCRKRCVTLQWLNEVLIRKRMEAPWKFCHLPSFWNEAKRPPSGTGKAIAVCGWSDIELINVKMMISAIGARFSPHLSCENDYLIARCESEKVERAREMGVKVLNYRWLLDAYTGICNGYPDSENLNYVLGTGEPCPEVSTTPYMMERHSDVYNKLLAPWKIPIIVNQELFNIGMELRKSIENNENIFPFKKVKQLTPAPTDEQIVQAQNILRELGETLPKCVIYFSGILPDDEKNLAKKAEFLGAEITTEVEKCTHFVCVSLLRTVELMKAIAMGKHIVSHNYIVYGYMILQFPDTYDLYLHDDENEKNYGYNLKTSIFRARSQAIFEDCIFHIMPSVHPSYKILSELVRISGGIVEEERPSPQFLADCIEYERPYFIIGCDADLHLYHYLMDCKYPIYNEEFVMLAVLRQEFDTSSNYLVNSNTIPPAVSTPSTPIQSRLPPAATMNGTANPLQNAAQQRVKAQ